MLCDRAGNYYACEHHAPRREDGPPPWDTCTHLTQRLDGKGALHWFVAWFFACDPHFQQQAHRAFKQPEFEFVPLIALKAKRRKTRQKKAAGNVFAGQLEMATALVAVVSQLAAQPTAEALSQACREVSALHQKLHAPETFKAATAA